MRSKKLVLGVFLIITALFIYLTIPEGGHEIEEINEFGEGFIADSDAEVFKSSIFSFQIQGEWKYGGSTVTQVSWSYSVSVTIQNIEHYNVTIEFGYKLSTASSITQLDSKTLTLQTESQTISDTGSEDLDTHTGRYVSNPQDGEIYYFNYYVRYTITGKGAKSGEIITAQSDWGDPKQSNVGLEYSEGFAISSIIVHEYGHFDNPTPSAGTDVTDEMTDGKHGLMEHKAGGTWDWVADPYIVFEITFQGSKDAKLRFYFSVWEYSEVPEQEWVYVAYLKKSDDGSNWDCACSGCDGPYSYDSYITSHTYTLEGTQYWKIEFNRMVDYEDEFYVSEIEVIESASSWFYGVAGFVVGFLVAFGIAFYALGRRR